MSKYYDRVDEATYLLVEDLNNRNGDTKQKKRRPSLTLAEKAYQSRWISIRLIYVLTFMTYVSYTSTLASLWAYLKVLEPAARASTMGWVVSAYGMGQIVSGPLFGLWANRRSIKEALVVSLLFNLLANVFYMYLASLPSHRGYYMIAARWIIGFSSASIPLARAYVANATTMSERTSAIANTNIFGAVGFILGPLVQAALLPISYPGPIESKGFHFNMYTAPILLSAVVSFASVMFIILFFSEHPASEDVVHGAHVSNTPHKDLRVDYVAAVACIILFFCSYFNFAFLETMSGTLTMHMFAWNKAKATLVQSMTIGGTALLSILVYVVIKWLSKRIQERTLFVLGFVTLVLSYVVIMPFGNVFPRIQIADIGKSSTDLHTTTIPSESFINVETMPRSAASDTTHFKSLMERIQFNPSFISRLSMSPTSLTYLSLNDDLVFTNKTTPLGCPWQYTWCQTVPTFRLFQFVLCLILFGIGYPTTNVLTISIFSKILGPKPMGLWIGVLIASGCLAGIIGPVLQTILYDNFGTRITFAAVGGFMVFTTLSVIFIYKRLRPFGEGNHGYSLNVNKG